RPHAANRVEADERAGAGVIDEDAGLLVVVDGVEGDDGRARRLVPRAPDVNGDAFLNAVERGVVNVCDVVLRDQCRSAPVDADAVEVAPTVGSAGRALDREVPDRHVLGTTDLHDGVGRRHDRRRLDEGGILARPLEPEVIPGVVRVVDFYLLR